MIDTREELKDYATRYTIADYEIKWCGNKWGIYLFGQSNICYDKSSKIFVFQPLPSYRTEDFLKNCRFGLIEAKEIVFELVKDKKEVQK